MFNKRPLVHPHSQQAGANKRSALMAHASLPLNRHFLLIFRSPSPNSACMWCDIKKESVTDLCHYDCSRLSILSCFCPSTCLTVKRENTVGIHAAMYQMLRQAIRWVLITLSVRVPSRLLEMVETTLHWATVW